MTTLLRGAALAVLFSILASTTSAPPTADEILQRHLAAIGGSARWQAVQSLMVRGSSSYGSFTWLWKRPDKMRSEELDDIYSGKKLVTAFDGRTGWISDPFKGNPAPRRLASAELQQWQTGFPVRSDLLDLPAKGAELKVVGREGVGGRDAWKLSLHRAGRDEVLLWIDAQSWLLVQRARKLRTPWKSEELIATPFGDYRNVEGLMIPHSVGSTRCFVEVNADIADALFAPPPSLP
ncbi:MAG: hypothetical protein JOZ54_20690 [Acidobacteria bacterium]|nr:hypothetical protein [Acidobacteriota bacterium]